MAKTLKLTRDVHKKIVAIVRVGNCRETAAAAAGINARTLRRWLRRGADGEEPYESFAEAVDEAEAYAEARDLRVIVEAGKTDWRAAAWRLERRGGARWGYKQQFEHTGNPVAMGVIVLPPEKDPESVLTTGEDTTLDPVLPEHDDSEE